MKWKYFNLTWIMAIILLFSACQDDEYALPYAKTYFQNDCIKRSLGPNIVGLNLEFIYGMRLVSIMEKSFRLRWKQPFPELPEPFWNTVLIIPVQAVATWEL